MATPYFSPVRLTASSEEAAISQALLMVGASREEVEFEVLDRNEKGVTVRVSPRREGIEAAAPVEASAIEAPAIEAPVEEIAVEEPAPAMQQDESDDADYQDDADDYEEAPADEPVAVAPAPKAIAVDPAQAARAQSLTQEFLDRMGLDAEARLGEGPAAQAEDSEQTIAQVFVDIEGEDVGILIGKHGQTLQSFQYLLNLTLNNRVEADDNSNVLRVIVDAGGYRSRRSQSLDQTARHAAARAKRDQRVVRLDPMPAHERRLVHIALRGDDEITTGSEGREPHRCVVITPKGVAEGGGRGRSGGRTGGNRFGGQSRNR